MEFARELPGDDHAAALEVLKRAAAWQQPPGREYQTAEAVLDHPLLKGCARAFFIKMEPGAKVHRHRDPSEVTDGFDTDHIVLCTNADSFICWEDEIGQDRRVHLELGRRYRIVDRSVLHWAENNGETDRIHLLIEYPKQIFSRRRA